MFMSVHFFVLFQSSKQQQIAPVKLEQSQIKLLNDNMRYVVAIIEARVNFGDDSDEDVCLTFCVCVCLFFLIQFVIIGFFCIGNFVSQRIAWWQCCCHW